MDSLRLLGSQRAPRGYTGVKSHPNVIGASKAMGRHNSIVKDHKESEVWAGHQGPFVGGLRRQRT